MNWWFVFGPGLELTGSGQLAALFRSLESVRVSDINSGSAALHIRAQTLTLLRCVLLPVPRE